MGIHDMQRHLRQMGVPPEVITMVDKSIAENKAKTVPALSSKALKRIALVIAEHKSAVVVLGRKGKYRIFTAEGYLNISRAAKKNKPWESIKRNKKQLH